MKLREMLEKRAGLVTEMRKLTANPAGEGGDLSAEQSTAFDKFKVELEALEKRIQREQSLAEIERRMQGTPISEGAGDPFDKLCRETSLVRAICSQIDPRAVDCGKEIEVSQELSKRSGRAPQGIRVPLNALVPQLEKRVQTVAADGQYLVQTDVLANEFIDALRPATVLGKLGTRILTGLVGDISIPKMDALTPSVEWLTTEGTTALSGGDHSFTAVTGSPKIAGLLTSWSRKTLLQSNPAIEQLVRSDFTRKLAVGVDHAGLKGTAANGQPRGLLNSGSGISVETLSAGAITWAKVLDMVATVQGADVPGPFGWTYNSHVEKKLRSTLKATDSAAGYIQDQPGNLGGYPVAITSQMDGTTVGSPDTPGEMLFGAFSELLVLFWGVAGADILINPFSDFAKGNVQVRAFIDMDIAIRHAEAFCKCTTVAVA